MRDPPGVLPGDTFVRVLFGDLGIDPALDTAALCDRVGVGVVHLRHRFDEADELRERLVLRPLVAGGGDGLGTRG